MQLIKPELDVAIVPCDPDATCTFYRDVIGLEEVPGITFGAGVQQHRFSLGNHRIKVNRMPQPPARQPGGVEAAVGIRLIALILDEPRFDAIVARLDAAGHRHSKLEVGNAPYRVELAKDPDGSVVELVGLKSAPAAYANRLQIGLTVADIERSRHFYGELLGLREEAPVELGGELGTRYAFGWGKTTIKFWRVARELPVHTGTPDRRSGLRTFTAQVADLDAAHAQLVAKDIPIKVAPFELPGVARILFFADPDGNWIELAQRL